MADEFEPETRPGSAVIFNDDPDPRLLARRVRDALAELTMRAVHSEAPMHRIVSDAYQLGWLAAERRLRVDGRAVRCEPLTHDEAQSTHERH